MVYLYCYLLLINIVTLIVFAVDKFAAKQTGKRRIPERNLLALSLIGGSLGALLGMELFHHKTRHKKFVICVPCFLVVHIVVIILLCF